MEDLEVGGRVEIIQTTALLKTARILRRVLETGRDLLSLKLQWKNNNLSSRAGRQQSETERKCEAGWIPESWQRTEIVEEHEGDGDTNRSLNTWDVY